MELKFILAATLVILVLTDHLPLRAADNAAQAAARLALEKELRELEATPALPAAATPPKIAAPPVTQAVIAPMTNATPATSVSTPPAPIVVAPTNFASVVVTPTVVTQAIAPIVMAPTNITPATPISVVIAPVAVAPPPSAKPSIVNPPITPKPSVPLKATTIVKPSSNIVTIYGTVYRNAEVEKVDTDGVVISYWTDAGGYSIIKLDFNQLKPEFIDQYRQ